LTPELILYGTSACHLCEEATAILLPITSASGIAMLQVDIADEDELMTRYGLRIPVLACNGLELDWPFNAEQIVEFLRCQKD
jgi:hypothetical protein